MKKIICVGALSVCFSNAIFSQQMNLDYSKSSIQVTLPKSPEAALLTRSLNEEQDYKGVSTIGIPLMSVKSRTLDIPISLGYSQSGVKVNQDATWVGLGFDLNVGGRIIVETRGNVDDNPVVRSYHTSTLFRNGISDLFTKWSSAYNPNPKASTLGYCYFDYHRIYGAPLDNSAPYWAGNAAWDDYQSISSSAWYGLSEPDIYHASFLGKSISFYEDIVTGSVEFIGEKKNYRVNIQRTNNIISGFTITDDEGIWYEFKKSEITKFTRPVFLSFCTTGEAALSWVLTKIKNGADEVLFKYNNYGHIYPPVNLSSTISGDINYGMQGYTNDDIAFQNQLVCYPQYLTEIETSSSVVNFIHSTREDIAGYGARKLSSITIKDKTESSKIVEEFEFTYGYFQSTVTMIANTAPDSIKTAYGKRLKLTELKNKSGGASTNKWKFFYNEGTFPDKLSYSVDHWGYYNGANNTSKLINGITTTGPINLIPDRINAQQYTHNNIGPVYTEYFPYPDGNYSVLHNPATNITIPSTMNGSAQRSCDEGLMKRLILDSIVYPTGGSKRYTYEAHVSNYQEKNISYLTGGGLRVKRAKSYDAAGKLALETEYSYEGGIYLGDLDYLRISNYYPAVGNIVLNSNGINSFDGIGYNSITEKQLDNAGISNGQVKKYFNVQSKIKPELSTRSIPTMPGASYLETPNNSFLMLKWLGLSSNQPHNLDGKLIKTEMLDKNNVLVNEKLYYWRQANEVNKLFSVKAFDNYPGKEGSFTIQRPTGFYFDGATNTWVPNPLLIVKDYGKGHSNYQTNWYRWAVLIEPAISYYSVLDSVVENDYSSAITLQTKNAIKYDEKGYPAYNVNYNSTGDQSITFSTYPHSYPHPSVPSNGENHGLDIHNMNSFNALSKPIEQLLLTRKINGDTVVLGGMLNIYDNNRVKKNFKFTSRDKPIFRTAFPISHHQIVNVNSFDLAYSPLYTIEDSVIYSGSEVVQEVHAKKKNKVSSFIWDNVCNQFTARCENAKFSDIAFTSFETSEKGNWTYSGNNISDPVSYTGEKDYQLSNGSVSKSGLSSGTTYTITYWTKNATAFSIAGTVSGFPIQKSNVNGWYLFEHKISGQTTVTISGTGVVDELRLYPANSLMVSYTAKPLIGITSEANVQGNAVYYEYDVYKRLIAIKDEKRNVLKRYCYNLYGEAEDCIVKSNVKAKNETSTPYTLTLLNTTTSVSNSYSVYPSSSIQDIATLPQGTYSGSMVPMYPPGSTSVLKYNGTEQTSNTFTISPFTLSSDMLFELLAPPSSNLNCAFTMQSGFSSPSSGMDGSSNVNVSFYIVFYSTSAMNAGTTYTIATINGCKPSQTRSVGFSSGSRYCTISFTPAGNVTFSFVGSNMTPYTTVNASSLSYPL